MKNFKLLFLTIIGLIFITSCSKDENDYKEENNNAMYFMKSFVDFGAAEFQYQTEGNNYCTYTKVGALLNIQSTYPDGSKMITLTMSNFTGVGLYPTITNIDGVSNIGQYVANGVSFTTTHQNYQGSIKITEYNPATKIIKGEFDLKTRELYGLTQHRLFGGVLVCKGLN